MAAEVALSVPTSAETRALGAAVAGHVRAGDVVVLTGELGAGKTTLVQGAAEALGVTSRVTSPSFVLRRDYQGRVPVAHLDVYRLEHLAEVADLGYEELLETEAVVFIEWGDAMGPLLPDEHLELELSFGPPELAADAGDEPRRLRARGHGPDWERRFGGLAAVLERWQAAEA
jgi:tRNA threonylcarbamoyladenosine biosynthesis protein TsaE